MSSKPNQSKQKKRTFGEAFGQNNYENERYNQEISEDYFTKGNIGHSVFTNTNINKNANANANANANTTNHIDNHNLSHNQLQFIEKPFKNKL